MSVGQLPKIQPQPRLEDGGREDVYRDLAEEIGAGQHGISVSNGAFCTCGGCGILDVRGIAAKFVASLEDFPIRSISKMAEIAASNVVACAIWSRCR